MAKSSAYRWRNWRGNNRSPESIGKNNGKVRRRKRDLPTTHKQRAFIRSLNQQIGKNYSIPTTRAKASKLIKRMVKERSQQSFQARSAC